MLQSVQNITKPKSDVELFAKQRLFMLFALPLMSSSDNNSHE